MLLCVCVNLFGHETCDFSVQYSSVSYSLTSAFFGKVYNTQRGPLEHIGDLGACAFVFCCVKRSSTSRALTVAPAMAMSAMCFRSSQCKVAIRLGLRRHLVCRSNRRRPLTQGALVMRDGWLRIIALSLSHAIHPASNMTRLYPNL